MIYVTLYQIALPTEAETQQIYRALRDIEAERITIDMRDSPWLMVEVWEHLKGTRKLALWRQTGAVHRVGPDGAVEDEPFLPGW